MSDGAGWHILLLRGLSRECAHWHDFPRQLRSRLPGLDGVSCLDLPGVGTASAVKSPWTVPEIAEAVRSSWLDRDPAHGRWCLVAISLGGMVAMAWADRHPDDFAGVVLINSSTRRVGGAFSRLRPGALADMVRGGLTRDLAKRERIALERSTSLVQGDRAEALIAERVRIAEARPVGRGARVRQLVAAGRFRGPETLAVPSLVVVSEADRLAAPSSSHRLAAMLDAPLRSHPDTGHDLPVDDPEWLADAIGAWLPPRETSPDS